MRHHTVLAFAVAAAISPARTAPSAGGPAPARSPDAGAEMVHVPGGAFVCGTDRGAPEEGPAHRRRLPDYFIDRHEVTNARFAAFVAATGAPPPLQWGGANPPAGQEQVPVTNITWFEAMAFARWAGKRLGDQLHAVLDTREEPAFDGGGREDCVRSLREGYLPVIDVTWHTGPVRYHHAFVASVLDGAYADDTGRRGDETVVLLTRLHVTNTAREPRTAWVHLRYSDRAKVSLDPDGVIRRETRAGPPPSKGLTPVRGQVVPGAAPDGTGKPWRAKPGGSGTVLSWHLEMAPGESRTMAFKAPFVELLEAGELDRMRAMTFEGEAAAVITYWRKRLASGTAIEVPDPALMNLYRASLWHVAITTDRDPVTGLYNQGVATVRYRVFANETIMIARAMDMRGEHREAERFIEPLLVHQGREPLTGRFSTKEGVFHSAGQYTHGQYAMNHGFVLWGAADHYLMTRDEARFLMWLRQLLVSEDGETLWFGRGIPRAWLEDGKRVNVARAPTRFGIAGLAIDSHVDQGHIDAVLTLPSRSPPAEVRLRLRHPEARIPHRVLLGGVPLAPAYVRGEDIVVEAAPAFEKSRVRIRAEY
jgi:hypothetical protein